jgi:hypothetical protein
MSLLQLLRRAINVTPNILVVWDVALQTLRDLRNSHVPGCPSRDTSVHMVFCVCACTHTRVHTPGNAVEIRTPTHGNLLGHSMTAPRRMLLPNNILPPPSSLCVFVHSEEKLCLFFLLFKYRVGLKFIAWNRISEGVCVLFCKFRNVSEESAAFSYRDVCKRR